MFHKPLIKIASDIDQKIKPCFMLSKIFLDIYFSAVFIKYRYGNNRYSSTIDRSLFVTVLFCL